MLSSSLLQVPGWEKNGLPHAHSTWAFQAVQPGSHPCTHLCFPHRPQVESSRVTRQSWPGASHRCCTRGELLPPAPRSSHTESSSAVLLPVCQHFCTSHQQPDLGPSEDLPQCFLTAPNQCPATQRGAPTWNLQNTAQIITAFKRLTLHHDHTARVGQHLGTAPHSRDGKEAVGSTEQVPSAYLLPSNAQQRDHSQILMGTASSQHHTEPQTHSCAAQGRRGTRSQVTSSCPPATAKQAGGLGCTKM